MGEYLIVRHVNKKNWEKAIGKSITDERFDQLKYTLTHEMGHMFGALHSKDDRTSIMYPSADREVEERFDEQSIKVINLTTKYAPQVAISKGKDTDLVVEYFSNYFDCVDDRLTKDDFKSFARDSVKVGDDQAAESYSVFAWFIENYLE